MAKAKPEARKPDKPYPGFPLTAHPNGQWCKKIRGKVHFFGVWADPDAALDNYNRQAPDLKAGRKPSPRATGEEISVRVPSREQSKALEFFQDRILRSMPLLD